MKDISARKNERKWAKERRAKDWADGDWKERNKTDGRGIEATTKRDGREDWSSGQRWGKGSGVESVQRRCKNPPTESETRAGESQEKQVWAINCKHLE